MSRIAIDQSAGVEISAEMAAKLEALEDAHPGGPKHQWTAEEDAVLLKYWRIKRQVDVAELLGLDDNTCRYRYRDLMKQREVRNDE